jgi:regulatory protein
MTISAIRQQERAQGRYSIFVDGAYAFSLSADGLLEAKLYVGQELDAEQLKNYKKASADDKAYGLALKYVIRRKRSMHELRDYFRRKGYDDALSKQIRQRLEKLGLVDDRMFAEAWVRNRRLQKAVSKRRLAQELKQKGVEDELIAEALMEDEADEGMVLRELIARRRKQSKYQDDQRLMQYLARQGFGYDDIKRALRGDED